MRALAVSRVVGGLAWASCLVAGISPAAWAQDREPLAGVVADVRVLTTSLPTSAGWTPSTLPTGTAVPGRGFGGELGAHVFFGPGRHRRLGVGGSGLFAQGRTSVEEPLEDGATETPVVTTRFTALAPHLSMNFGHRLGWSYLSLGLGRVKISSAAEGETAEPAGWGNAIHYGFGGRWFLRDRVAVSLDLRFWALTPRPETADRPRGPANTRVVLGGGIAFR